VGESQVGHSLHSLYQHAHILNRPTLRAFLREERLARMRCTQRHQFRFRAGFGRGLGGPRRSKTEDNHFKFFSNLLRSLIFELAKV
jgi:hypothetical protein